jgi:YXWGXW repeat-containing protein
MSDAQHVARAAAAVLIAASASLFTLPQPASAAEYEMIVPRGPPPPRVEVVPQAPGPYERFEWVPGHWAWGGRGWIWAPGHYIARPHVRAHWVPDEWVRRGHHWVLIPGHWS